MGTTRSTRLTISTACALALGLMLGGCTAAGPAPVPTGAPSGTATAAAATPSPSDAETTVPVDATTPPAAPSQPADALASVDQIVMSSSSFSLRAAGAEVGSVPFVSRDLDGAVATLTRALGTPVPDGTTGGHCVLSQTRYSWGGALNIGTRQLRTDPGSLSAEITAARLTTPDGRTVSLSGPSGVVVGTSVAPLVAATPAEQVDASWKDVTNVAVDPLRRMEDTWEVGFYGTLVHAPKDVITTIAAPVTLYDYC